MASDGGDNKKAPAGFGEPTGRARHAVLPPVISMTPRAVVFCLIGVAAQ